MVDEHAEILDVLYEAILVGDADLATAATENGLQRGVEPIDLLYLAMIPALEEIGRDFEVGQCFVPEMLVAARAMGAGMELIRPHLAEGGTGKAGTFLMGTVAGDIHDIGKNLCNVMLEGAGFEVIDLGVNVPADAFVDAVQRHRPDVVGMSAFLTTTMPEIQHTIAAVADAELRNGVKIIIGGAPVTQEFAQHSGADGYAPDASSAVRVTKELLA